MDALMLDGNSVAGLLGEVFAVEMTTAMGTCSNCGATGPLGATHVYRGAGIIMRCPRCGTILVTIVEEETRIRMGFPGIRTIQFTTDES